MCIKRNYCVKLIIVFGRVAIFFYLNHSQKVSHVNPTGPNAIKYMYLHHVPTDEIILAHTGLTLYTCALLVCRH